MVKEVKYEHLEHADHILKLPDSYVGSIENNKQEMYIYDNTKIILKEINYNQAFYKIFDEIISNSMDQHTRTIHSKENKEKGIIVMNKLEININKDTGYISILNNGNGINITKQLFNNNNIYTIELIFGILLTSQNYDADNVNISAGKNGYGAKLSNIFSLEFEVETIDKKRKLKYTQTWKNNMREKLEPIILEYIGEPYTKITFLPDYKRFKMNKLTNDMMSLLIKRVYDCGLWFSNNGMLINNDSLDKKPKKYEVNIILNGEPIECNLEKYINLYNIDNNIINKKNIFIMGCYRWEVAIIESPNNKFNQISMINGITTNRGGKHVEHIVNNFLKKCIEIIKKKKKFENITQNMLKDYIWIFIKHIKENPTFDSQTKENMTTPIKDNKCDFDIKFIDKFIKNSNIITKLENLTIINDNKVKIISNKNRSTISIPKLSDANFAGTKKSNLCTLILTEGDSAMSSAISGISIIKNGRDIYGVFPLKGKLLNVRDETLKRISDNLEIINIMKILGLNFNVKYTDTSKLRYNNIMILTDQDVDGFHIKGLLINLFDKLFPELLDLNSFITCLSTPIIKATKGKEVLKFYTLSDYEQWSHNITNLNKYTIKYYKGLGTSNRLESQEYFKEMKLIEYYLDENGKQNINKVFSTELADERKEWLKSYDKINIIALNADSNTKISFTEFVDLELKHFSNYDNIRSIPSLLDGLKPSQRKILWACFKKNLTTEIKVAQLSGYVSECSEYHHGEMSLQGCIIAMAQDFIGSNNLNLLYPSGQFGTRIAGGFDHASARYIFTKLMPITSKLFNKLDEELLEKQYEDTSEIEYKNYIPLLPLILINGSTGIGTGYSTNILQYNPIDIISNIKKLINNNEMDEINPYYRNFKGQIIKESHNKYMSYGILKQYKNNIIQILELPIGTWMLKMEEHLDKLYTTKQIESYVKYSTDIDIKYEITFKEPIVLTDNIDMLCTLLKLKKPLNATNMVLYNKDYILTKYNDVNDIIKEFYDIRIEYYFKRKDLLLAKYNYDKLILENKIRFITSIINKELIINNKEDDILLHELKDNNYYEKDNSYDYLLDMNLRSLTLKKLNDLKQQLNNIIDKLDALNLKSPHQLYIDDIHDFEKVYNKEYIK